jgi:hypothetical protein
VWVNKKERQGEKGERNYRLTTIPARVERRDEDVGMVRSGKGKRGGGEKGVKPGEGWWVGSTLKKKSRARVWKWW